MLNKSTNVVQLACPTETAECFTFAEWCYLNPKTKGRLLHFANEGKRSPAHGGKLKRMGMRPGTSDYILAVKTAKYPALFLEMKRRDQRKSRLSPLQSEFIHDMRMGGYAAVVAYGAQDAIDLVTKYLSNEL